MNLKRVFIPISIIVILLLGLWIYLETNKPENILTIDNTSSSTVKNINVYLTKSTDADDQIIYEKEFGSVSEIPPDSSKDIVFSESTENEPFNIVLEYKDMKGTIHQDFVNNYIPENSKHFNHTQVIENVDENGVITFRSY